MKPETITFIKDHRANWHFANTEKYRVEYYPETNAVLIIDDCGDHVAYRIEEDQLIYTDSTNGDFLENEEDFVVMIEEQIKIERK